VAGVTQQKGTVLDPHAQKFSTSLNYSRDSDTGVQAGWYCIRMRMTIRTCCGGQRRDSGMGLGRGV